MRKSARAGAAAQSAAQSAMSRPAILNVSMQWKGLIARHIGASAALSTFAPSHKGLGDWRLQRHLIVAQASTHRHVSCDVPSRPTFIVAPFQINARPAGRRAQRRVLMLKSIGVSVFAIAIASSAGAQQIGDVFYIALENHISPSLRA